MLLWHVEQAGDRTGLFYQQIFETSNQMAERPGQEAGSWLYTTDLGLSVWLHRKPAEPNDLLGADGRPRQTNPDHALRGTICEIKTSIAGSLILRAVEAGLQNHEPFVLPADQNDPRALRECRYRGRQIMMGVQYEIHPKSDSPIINLFFEAGVFETHLDDITEGVVGAFGESLLSGDYRSVHVTRSEGWAEPDYLGQRRLPRPGPQPGA